MDGIEWRGEGARGIWINQAPINSCVVVGCMGGVGGVIGVGGCRRGVAGVCGGIVGGRVHFVQNAFFTFKKCTST